MANLLSKRVVILKCVLFVIIVSFISNTASQRLVEQDIFKKILSDPNYDRRIRPARNASEPVAVSVNLYVRTIDTIDEAKMEYSVQLSFRQEWNDWRLSFFRHNPSADLQYLSIMDVNQIWRPDTFFSNEKRSHLHNLMVPNHFVRVQGNGDVMYSSRVSMTLNCTMDLRKFPFDEQKCSLRLASYGYTTNDVRMDWKEVDPVQVSPYIVLPRFTFGGIETETCDSHTTTGSYSCLLLHFKFNREFNYYLIQLYIPCLMLVIISWLSFWLDRRAITARVILTISSLLVMATQVSSFNQRLPPVSYTTALDRFTGISLTFVFASLLQLIVVNYLVRLEDAQGKSKPSSQTRGEQEEDIPLSQGGSGGGEEAGEANDNNKPTQGAPSGNKINRFVHKYLGQFTSTSEKIDGVSRVLFPLFYVLFGIIYFIVYL